MLLLNRIIRIKFIFHSVITNIDTNYLTKTKNHPNKILQKNNQTKEPNAQNYVHEFPLESYQACDPLEYFVLRLLFLVTIRD